MNTQAFNRFSDMSSSDYHPTIARVRKNMKKAFKKSLNELQDELADHQLYRENYDFMMFSPMATRLNQKITELTSQNNDLKWANAQMRAQLLEYEQLMTKIVKKNGKSLRKLARKPKTIPTPTEEEYHLEDDSVLPSVAIQELSTSVGIDSFSGETTKEFRMKKGMSLGEQHSDEREPECCMEKEYSVVEVVNETPAPSSTDDVLSSHDNNVVDENISFELTEDITSDPVAIQELGTSVGIDSFSGETTKEFRMEKENSSVLDDDSSHIRSLENELEDPEEAEPESAAEEAVETEDYEADAEEAAEEAVEEEVEEEAEEEAVESEAEEEAVESDAEEEEAVESEAEEEAVESDAEEADQEEEEEAVESEAEEAEEEEEAEAEEVEEEVEEEAEEEEVYEVRINGKQYFTTNEKNGVIYAIDSDGEVGDEIGCYVSGVATFKKI